MMVFFIGHKKGGNTRPSIIITKPTLNATLKILRTLVENQICEYVPGKSIFHLLWPRTRRGIKSITSDIRWGQIRGKSVHL